MLPQQSSDILLKLSNGRELRELDDERLDTWMVMRFLRKVVDRLGLEEIALEDFLIDIWIRGTEWGRSYSNIVMRGFRSLMYFRDYYFCSGVALSRKLSRTLLENMISFLNMMSYFISYTLWVGTMVRIECSLAEISIF